MLRYAIYFVPNPTSPLWAFGSSVLGYDSAAGLEVPFPAHPMFQTAEARALSEAPRKYGFHGTLKAPFELADAGDEAALCAAVEAFARDRRPVRVKDMSVVLLGSFVALVPKPQERDLEQLAGDCVTEFDRFRAPLSQADRERRLKSKLSPDQIANLDRWGYPYVFDAFRFHMSLTGPLPAHARDRVHDVMSALFEPLAGPIDIDAIAVCAQQTRDSRFVVLNRFRFGAV
ncbi:MAG: DUF1045 domain-containing protein [Pseudomonadota bacterium]